MYDSEVIYLTKFNKFIRGTAILSIAGIIVKILGALYRIPLGNIIRDEGMGYYQTAYPFYILLLTISTSGFPVAIAKLVSEKRAIGDYKGAYKVFRIALTGLTIGGLLSFLFVLSYGRKIVEYMDNRSAYYALIALGPALLFVPLMSAFRGFFQGSQNMVPTAISQIVEQVTRLVVGLSLTYLLLDYGLPLAAGGASFGGSAGAILGSITMFIMFRFSKKTMEKEMLNAKIKESSSSSEIIRDLLRISIPITIGASLIPIMDTIDASLVIRRLATLDYTRSMANELYGQLKGFAQVLINLPQVFSLAIGMSLMPAITEASAKNDGQKIRNLTNLAIRVTLIIGLPCAFGLFSLAKPIINLLYFKNTPTTITSAGEILAYLSFGVIFLMLIQVTSSILQGLGKEVIPVINLFIAAVFKLIFTYSLTGIRTINIKGAAISTVFAYAIAGILNLSYIISKAKIKVNLKDILFKPLAASILMAMGVRILYSFLISYLQPRITTLISIGLGMVLFIILLFITGTIKEEDMVIWRKDLNNS